MISMSVEEKPVDDKYSTDELKKLKKKIEKKDQLHHKKILEIIVKNNINFSENNNGVFLSLNKLPSGTIKEIENYLKYIDEQEVMLDSIKSTQDVFEKEYFSKTV
jgi:D-mannonate dehydratase